MNQAPYPRPESEAKRGAGCGRKILGAFLSIVGAGAGCCVAPAQLMAEGPHGPHGEITGDPNGPRAMVMIGLIGLALIVTGFVLMFRGPRSF